MNFKMTEWLNPIYFPIPMASPYHYIYPSELRNMEKIVSSNANFTSA